MKKKIYLFLSVILFIALSFIIHAAIEYPIILLLVSDFDKYSFGITWGQMMLVHRIFTIFLLLSMSILGYFVGQKWWQYVYVDRKYKKNIKI
ncbi:hypothetical protein C0584_04470 [Candidatus Parcubacteria bacterium]|nr:MAG: hypothetical protein C0584_04470 [Candidatus Parcubacteria bacterium]